MSLSLINHLLQSYGYYAVFVFIALESLGIPLPGETTLIAAAIYAGSTGHLNIVVVFLVWVYLQAVILLYGVEFTAAYARLRRGRPEEVPAAPTPRA